MTLNEVRRIQIESCHEYIGVPVCAVMKDGTHIYGIMGGMQDGKVVLHRAAQGPGKLSVSAAQARKSLAAKAKQRSRSRVGTKALGYPYPYPYPYPGAYAVDAALIALLFALPFFLI